MSTLKIMGALLGLLISLSPAMAGAKSKPWKQQVYCDPVDIACQMSNGQFGSTSSKKVAVRRGPDCGQADAEAARGLNVVSNLAGLAPVPGIGIVFGIVASEASAQAEKKQWGCLERSVKSRVASGIKGIERQHAQAVAEMQTAIVNMANHYDNQIAVLEMRLALYTASSVTIMQHSVCEHMPTLCKFESEPKLLSGPAPAERPKGQNPPASTAPSKSLDVDPGRQERAEPKVPNYGGTGFAQHVKSQRTAVAAK